METPPPSPEPRPDETSRAFELGRGAAPLGEAQVWTCSMGLALGILMTLFLLGLIFVKGFDVFWPHRVVQFELSPGSEARLGESGLLAGVVTMEREAGSGSDVHRETQFFIGNRDAWGLSFRFVRDDEIGERTYPEGIVMAERMEYGNAIFFPVELRLHDGTVIPAESPAFESAFRQVVREVRERRKAIKELETDVIGRNAARISEAELRIRAAEDDPGLSEEKRASIIAEQQARIDALQSEYDKLAAEAGELRERQESDVLAYRLATGEDRTLKAGELVSFHYPNRLTLLQRTGLFLERLWGFLSQWPRNANTEGGIYPALFGTFVMTIIMSVLVTPFGVIAAIYLREYARQGLLVQWVRISVNNLAGVPSIVFGVFGLGFFVYLVGGSIDRLFFPEQLPTATFGTSGLLWASLTLALLTLPVVIVATEEALVAVPRGVREAALACGASKWQTIQRVVLPSATPGILTGVILAMARGAGEVAPLMLVGVIKSVSKLPLDGEFPFIHLERKFMHLGFHIYDLGFQSPDSEAAKPMVFATTFFLILLVVVMNLAAILLRNHLRKKYKLASF